MKVEDMKKDTTMARHSLLLCIGLPLLLAACGQGYLDHTDLGGKAAVELSPGYGSEVAPGPEEQTAPEETAPEETPAPEETKPVEPPAPLTSFSIGTQNLWHDLEGLDQRNENMHKRLDSFTPQVVAFQETWSHFGVTSVYETFQKRTGFLSSFCETADYGLMSEGMAISTTFDLPGYGCLELPHSKLFFERWANISAVIIEGQEVMVINVHLSPDDGAERMDQLGFLAQHIKSELANKKVILLGDFNQPYGPEFFGPLEALGFVHVDQQQPPIFTFSSDNPYTDVEYAVKIDFIFYRTTDFTVKDFGAWGEDLPVADHTGIWAELQFK